MFPDWFEKGGPVMYPLLACSFLSGVVLIERFLYFLSEKTKRKRKDLKQILESFASGNIKDAEEKAKKSSDFAAPVLLSGLQSAASSASLAMEAEATKQLAKCERFLPLLQTIITLSPLLGILGTVLGIIKSFEVLGASAIAEPRAVTSGVAEALLTTAFGLTIAIFTLLPYNFFSRRLEMIQSRIENFSTQLEVLIARDENSPRPR